MRIRSCLLMLLVLTAATAFAQDPDIDTYMGAWPFLQVIIQSLLWGVIYFAIVTFGLIASLVFLQRYTGLDTALIFWIAALWVGILVIQIFVYQPFIPHRLLSILLAAPLIFGLTVLICIQSWADLSTREAMIVAIVLVVLCTPYLIPPWRLNRQPRPSPPEEDAYQPQLIVMQPVVDCTVDMPDGRQCVAGISLLTW